MLDLHASPKITPSNSLKKKILQRTEKVAEHFLRGSGLSRAEGFRGFVDRLDCMGTANVLKVGQMTIFGIREISKKGGLAFASPYVSLHIGSLCS